MRLTKHIAFRLTMGLFLSFGFNPYGNAVVKPRLSSIFVRVNDEEREVRRGETLTILQGDQLTLLFAKLENSPRGPEIINLVGFRRNDIKTRVGDDRDVLIDTAELRKKWSVGGKGREYRIEAKTGSALHGSVMLSVVQPVLNSIVLSINGQAREIKPDERLEILASDQIQVQTIHTNDLRIDREARVQFQESPLNGPTKTTELQLWFRSVKFASIPILVKSAVK